MHTHISGVEGVKTALFVIVIIGTLNLIAMKFMGSNRLAASWANLFGLS